MNRVAVFGLALTGRAVATALASREIDTVVSDDADSSDHRAFADSLDATWVSMGESTSIDEFLDGVDTLMPAPGVPLHHEVIRRAIEKGISIRTEIDVAYEWEQTRVGGARPILGVTGTDGKTTTTMLTAAILRANEFRVAEVGNTDIPFMAALDDDVDVFVVECSSFRLQFTDMFRCDASVWLNLAPDHLDWHGTLANYTDAKKKLWSHALASDVAIASADHPLIVEAARQSDARVVTFGLSHGDYRFESGVLLSPHGVVTTQKDLWRSMPHDITNSLAAAALAVESGLCPINGVSVPLRTFTSAHHRIELVGEFAGSSWYDDSKATSPHAALTAIRAFDDLVLIAGGRNKDLDLSQLASEPGRMRGVVAIGDDAQLIADAFGGICPVVTALSMKDAVTAAAEMASPGVSVLLSPGCTSYDWYRNYNERGDDFQMHVRTFFTDKSRSQ
jgi:UDP-N-acetylmuramoylalanine--D-glutamate ligase